MKFFIAFAGFCLTSMFYISDADDDFFILVHPRIHELFPGDELIKNKYIQRIKNIELPNMCEMVKKANIFIAKRPMIHEPTNDNEFDEVSNYLESRFFLNKDSLFKTNETVPDVYSNQIVLLNNKTIETPVITCEFGESEKNNIYLTRQQQNKHYFLFGKTDKTDMLPKLLAIVINYLKLDTVTINKGIENVAQEYIIDNDKARSHRVAKKLFEEDGVDIFQLCASILFHESDSDQQVKYKYIMTIPGPRNNLSSQFPAYNININIPVEDDYMEMWVPVLTCQIKQKEHDKLALTFKFYIVPDITIEDSSCRIFVKFVILRGSEVTEVKYYKLPYPWRSRIRKHLRQEEEIKN